MALKQYWREYLAIREHYGDRTAERSGVPLINHIDEGLAIMRANEASEPAMRAFCLHPLIQADEDLAENYTNIANYTADPLVIVLAMEYRRATNAYLCKYHTDDWGQIEMRIYVGALLPEVRQMLYADKVQNQKDFALYHQGTHERSIQLARYFNNWMIYLLDTK